MRPVPFIALLTAAAFLAGCGQSGPQRFEVSGVVTFDGEPVADGEVLFLPEDGQGRPDAGRIINGRFECEVTAGRKRVEVRASRENPDKLMASAVNPGEMVPMREEYIPARYNTESELVLELAPGANAIEIPLESDSPASGEAR